MTENRDENIARIFTRAESELIDQDFRALVMRKVTRQRRRSLVSRCGPWILVLLCSLFIIPMVVELLFALGSTLGDSPVLVVNWLQGYLDFPIVLLVISAVIGYLLNRFHLLRLPRLHLFGRIRIFRLYT